MSERLAFLKSQLAHCQSKSEVARNDTDKRAWLLAASAWQGMVEREELKAVSEPPASLAPSGNETEQKLRQLAELISK